MSTTTATDRVLMALSPRHRRVTLGAQWQRFLAEVEAEAGPAEVARIVHTIEAAAPLSGRAVA